MSDLTPGTLVKVFYAKAWHRAVVIERGPAPGFARGWPGVSCQGDMLRLLVDHRDGLRTAGRPWDLMVAAESDTVRAVKPPVRGSADDQPQGQPRDRGRATA